MNEAQALLMCIPATAIAITVLIWLQAILDRMDDRERLRERPDAHEQRMEMLRLTVPPCLACHESPALCRGNCSACYHMHRAAVRAGLTTWTELVREGLALSPWRSAGSSGRLLLQLVAWGFCVLAVSLGFLLEISGESLISRGWVFILVGLGGLLAMTAEAIRRHLG